MIGLADLQKNRNSGYCYQRPHQPGARSAAAKLRRHGEVEQLPLVRPGDARDGKSGDAPIENANVEIEAQVVLGRPLRSFGRRGLNRRDIR